MKRFIYLVFMFLIIGSCTKDEEQVCELSCETQNLKINELSRFSYFKYINIDGEELIDHVNSYRWDWKINNDTIEIAGNFDSGGEGSFTRHIFLKKNDENCIDFLFARSVSFDDGGVILDDETGEIIQHGFTWFDYYDLDFTIQEYVEDEKLVGQVGGFNFWMEFTPDVHRLIPYYYEQYID